MKAKLQKIGNSKGIRIPKALLQEIGLETEVELTVENNRLVISPVKVSRADWESQLAQRTQGSEERLIPDGLMNAFDETEWTW